MHTYDIWIVHRRRMFEQEMQLMVLYNMEQFEAVHKLYWIPTKLKIHLNSAWQILCQKTNVIFSHNM
jgi:hypothetical protein